VLTGASAPSGKLSQSWPQTVGQVGGGSVPWLQRTRGKWVANSRGCVESEGRCYDAYGVAFAPPPWPNLIDGRSAIRIVACAALVATHHPCPLHLRICPACSLRYTASAFPSTPLFHFGFGLTYTEFDLKNGTATRAPNNVLEQRLHGEDDIVWNVSVTVANTGKHGGVGRGLVRLFGLFATAQPFRSMCGHTRLVERMPRRGEVVPSAGV
jgi:hypothetical protein